MSESGAGGDGGGVLLFSKYIDDNILTPLLSRLQVITDDERFRGTNLLEDLGDLRDFFVRMAKKERSLVHMFDPIERLVDDVLESVATGGADAAMLQPKLHDVRSQICKINKAIAKSYIMVQQRDQLSSVSTPAPAASRVYYGGEHMEHFRRAVQGMDMHLRQCLLCLAAFPEGAVIKKRLLIHWWMGEGFVDCIDTGKIRFQQLVDMRFVSAVLQGHCVTAHACTVHPWIRRTLVAVARGSAFLDADPDDVSENDFSWARRACLRDGGAVSPAPFKFHPEICTIYNVDQKYIKLSDAWFSNKAARNCVEGTSSSDSKMPATATGGARPEDSTPAPPASTSCMGSRPEDLTARLAATGPGEGERVRALREIKNQIIGNRTKKLLYLRLGAVPAVVAALAEPGASTVALVQAAAAAGSFACGVEDGARAVLDAGAAGHLTRLLAHPDEKVVDASARALRMIYQSKLAPKFDFNNEKNMDFLLSLLRSENENVTELAATIISHSCESNMEQLALCSAGVPQRLVSLFGGSMNLRDACLDALTSIIRNNKEVASKFALMDHGKAFHSIVGLIHDRSPRTRLLACLCVIVLGHAAPCHFQDRPIKTKLILVLLELMEEPGQVGDEAPLALTTLIKDSLELQKQALTTNAVEKLINHLLENSLETGRAATILVALSELCSRLEESRSQLMSVQVLTLLFDALKHDCENIRVAACSCLKNMSRSAKVLSGGQLFYDTLIGPLVQLLYDPSTSVQVAALGAICNIAVNLTPRKSAVLHSGVVSQLIHLSKSMDPTLRLKSVWALRNIMFLLSPKDKDFVMKKLTLSTLSCLICDSEHFVQEQALALVHNLVDGYLDSSNYVIGEDGMVLDVISRQLNNASAPGVCIQGMFVLANIAAGNELNRELVMSVLFPHRAESMKPSFVVKFLQSKDKQLRVATLWCILNLIYPKCEAASGRVVRLQSAGVILQVKNMTDDPSLDCKLRVRMVLEHCLDSTIENCLDSPLENCSDCTDDGFM